MTSLPEQLSEARKWQFEAQLDFMRAVTAQAFESAGQVLALNINTSRASVERSANTLKQLFAITDPRDLFTLGAQTQEQLQTMMDYSRELFTIASGAPLEIARQAAAAPVPQPVQPPAPAVTTPEPAAAAAPAPAPKAAAPAPAEAATEKQAAKTVQPSKKPLVVAEEPAPEQPARAKPIAKAAGDLVAKPATPPHPSASPVPSAVGIEIAPIHPVDAAPPPPGVTQAKQAQPATRSRRKK